ncbi:hypothetical protein AYO49_04545 [Verrucomicrobiaceae bacterium SCGC AG-212-N21]|nr:hypothetical protein AYO49_04545 [Verrucomicrobiaceae bacterium SCGC AG-212-N21]
MTAPHPLPLGFDSPEHFLSAIIDSSDDAIITKSLEGIVTSWNPSAERLFGYTAKEMIGQPVLILIPEDRREEEPMILAKLRRGERVDHFETKRRNKDGTLLDISLTISPVKNRAGEIVGASKIARDITAQKQAAAALVAAAEETTRQSRMKDEFLSTLSHELRTPLQSIVGWVEILKSGRLDPGELEQAVEVIDRNVRAQQHIIEDLLDMNRILSGKVRMDVQRVDVGPILHAAVESVRPSALAKGVELNAIIGSSSHLVLGDAHRLQQVFWNLLSNAIKFTPKGGRVEASVQRVNSHFEISVTDTGIGIDPAFLPYVFDRFRQADASVSRVHTGLGLGLAIVKHLVELHGGTVLAKSNGVNQGATLSVTLPLAALSADALPKQKPAAMRNSSMPYLPRLDGISVLVVDDDHDSRRLICRALTKAGAIVREAPGTNEALSVLDESVPHVLVSDIGMPGRDGFSLVEALRARPAERGGIIPAIALTAYSRVEDRVHALCSGFQILLPKPANSSELVASIRSLTMRP